MQPNFISAETNTEKLYQLNSFLKRLASDVDWEAFRPILSVLRKAQPKGRCPPFDVVLMFKIIVLKSQYNLSDEMTEFFIHDRKTFQDFLAITPYQTIPDAKTIWLFAEQMKNASLEGKLFDKFLEMLESKEIKPQGGTLVEVPRQHNTKGRMPNSKRVKSLKSSSRILIGWRRKSAKAIERRGVIRHFLVTEPILVLMRFGHRCGVMRSHLPRFTKVLPIEM